MSSLTLWLRSIVHWRIPAYISSKSSEIALNGQQFATRNAHYTLAIIIALPICYLRCFRNRM